MSTTHHLLRTSKLRLAVGDELRGPTRCMTRERMRWYADMLHVHSWPEGSVVEDDPVNIHTEVDFAKSQGLPGLVADGPITTNWLFGLVFDFFGAESLGGGSMETKHIRPTVEDAMVTTCARITSLEALADGKVRCGLELWSQDAAATPLTVGKTSVVSDRVEIAD
jgi:3-hydroxybutyryl-CoA dehydratase